ncbi:hypothetical protein CPB86DRAFT_799993 [Serendipita vermifera]|nr:hypothetical protein CPB86DRAFT_799993 [Serendipita vermifera]
MRCWKTNLRNATEIDTQPTDITTKLAALENSNLMNLSSVILEVISDDKIVNEVTLSPQETNSEIWETDKILILYEVLARFTVSISAEVDGNGRQLLGSIELSEEKLHKSSGKPCGKYIIDSHS